MKAQSRLYIVEGEIEEQFIHFLISKHYIKPGKIHIFNLMQQELKQSNNILTKQHDKVFCIIDTDCTEKPCIEKLCHNYKILCQANTTVKIIPQHHNFEEELSHITGKKNLNEALGISHSGKQNLKRKLSNYKYDNIIKKSPSNYCTDTDNIKSIINHHGYSIKKSAFSTGIELTK